MVIDLCNNQNKESENLYVLCCASPVPMFVASPIDDLSSGTGLSRWIAWEPG
jgi:hypothetical protein